MIGVILAAGAGTRLNGSRIVRPKCLAPFGGTPLLELQLRALRGCGIRDVAIVVGFEADRVRRASGPGVQFVENARFAETNSLYSLWLARRLLAGGFVVLNCDVLFHPSMLVDLLTARHENALLVSHPRPGDPEFGDEEMKVCIRRGCVVDIRKDLTAEQTDGENVGIVRFGARGATRLVGVLDRIVSAGRLRDWAPRAFADFAREEPLYALGTRGLPWTEIDTPEDYAYAVREIYPAIEAALRDVTPALRRGA
ncbi:MAG TPA: phosphocholine cytidylyltransferase family protein [Vicinamibacterales bacterium]|nr:phosphocholine cytidylyltransferase family protein [Vicinamibacterales bacterium]